MQLEDLKSLKLALDTNNPGLYHGNWEDVLSEVVDDLLEFKEPEEENEEYKVLFEQAEKIAETAIEEIDEIKVTLNNYDDEVERDIGGQLDTVRKTLTEI